MTEDLFLGGRLTIRQPKSGYRAGADPVFLAAAVDAAPGDTVLDVGCGVGVAMLCLKARVPDVQITGIELQKPIADLADQNLVLNGMDGEVVHADLANPPANLRERSFDHVLTNPPFFDPAEGSAAAEAGREAGRRMAMSLAAWLDLALRRLRPEGSLTMINRIERLPDCLRSAEGRLGGIKVLPLTSRGGRPAKLFILNGRKGGRAPMALLSPIVLHEGADHLQDGDNYSQIAKSVLRDGSALPL